MLHADQEGERVNEINTVARNRLVDIEEGGKKKGILNVKRNG